MGERFVLCEGEEDAAFTRAIIDGRNAHQPFDVSPNIDVGGIGGNSGFEQSFLAVEPLIGFANVRHVVVVADNDDDPAVAFQAVINKVEGLRSSGDLKRNWGTATRAGERFPGDPSVSVWMWPAPAQRGCLETLLWQVIARRNPTEAACAEAACKCAGVDQWPMSKYHKARVRCFLSLVCKRNPAISLSLLWRDYKNLIPVASGEFTPFSDFLRAAYAAE
jgi:hypothetical protein